MYKRILMPTDGSSCSVHAIQQGLELAKLTGAEVTFLYVVENPIASYGSIAARYGQEILGDLRKVARDALQKAHELAQQAEVTAETSLAEGENPIQAIVKAAEGHDLIIMGTRGRTGLELMLLGSVTDAVIHLTQKPILVIHCPRTS